jgi:hypothetical protein
MGDQGHLHAALDGPYFGRQDQIRGLRDTRLSIDPVVHADPPGEVAPEPPRSIRLRSVHGEVLAQERRRHGHGELALRRCLGPRPPATGGRVGRTGRPGPARRGPRGKEAVQHSQADQRPEQDACQDPKRATWRWWRRFRVRRWRSATQPRWQPIRSRRLSSALMARGQPLRHSPYPLLAFICLGLLITGPIRGQLPHEACGRGAGPVSRTGMDLGRAVPVSDATVGITAGRAAPCRSRCMGDRREQGLGLGAMAGSGRFVR